MAPKGLLGGANAAPYGVIFDGSDKVIVGARHGSSVVLSDDLKDRVQTIARKYGAWFEGDGKDVAPIRGLLGEEDYKGSWDDLVAKSVKGYPPEFLSGLFSNTEINEQKKIFLDPKSTIFDSILNRQNKFNYFKDRKFNAATLAEFLKGGSEKNIDLFKLSQLPATKDNLVEFFDVGEKLMWPDNWQDYPNKLGKFAEKFERARNQGLLSDRPGVYVAGSGHLPELISLDKNLKMIGGSKAIE